MARLAVFTSGSGSNFQAIAEYIKNTEHTVACMICDRKDAYSFSRAENLGIKSYYVSYYKRSREDAEKEIIDILDKEKADLISLAGFMRLITPLLLEKYSSRIINIHPALLPKYPGAHGIEESFNSKDKELGLQSIMLMKEWIQDRLLCSSLLTGAAMSLLKKLKKRYIK